MQGITATALVIGGLLLGSLPAHTWAAAPGDQAGDPGALAREIVAREEFQSELVPIEGLPGDAGDPTRPWLEPYRRRGSTRDGGSGEAAFSTLLLWVALFAAVVAVIVWSSRQLRRPAADAALVPGPAQAPPEAPALDAQPSADARELARQGRFAEALRALLHDTTVALGRAQRLRLTPSLTSREIAGRLDIDGDRRAAYDALMLSVETSTFGTHAAGAADWNHAVEQYRLLRRQWQAS